MSKEEQKQLEEKYEEAKAKEEAYRQRFGYFATKTAVARQERKKAYIEAHNGAEILMPRFFYLGLGAWLAFFLGDVIRKFVRKEDSPHYLASSWQQIFSSYLIFALILTGFIAFLYLLDRYFSKRAGLEVKKPESKQGQLKILLIISLLMLLLTLLSMLLKV